MTTKTTSANAPKKHTKLITDDQTLALLLGDKPTAKPTTRKPTAKAVPFVGPLLPGLPAPKQASNMPTQALSLSSKIDRVNTAPLTAAKLANLQAAISELAPAKMARTPTGKLNAFGNSKGYGDKYPNEGTSALCIWQAIEKHTVDGILPTVAALKGMTLTYTDKHGAAKTVNPANVAIELNSYKKWLANQSVSKAA